MAAKRAEFAHYPKLTYATIQDGLLRVAQEKDLGKNGLKVLICLCRCVYADGKLGIMGSEAMQRVSGMTRIQVMHGMEELRRKEIIIPVVKRTKAGAYRADKSMTNHVAQYRFTRQVWDRIETQPQREIED